MSEKQIINAKITNTKLGYERGNFMSFSLTLEWESGGVCFGGVVISTRKKPWATGMIMIMDILDTVGVGYWEDLKGQYIRVEVGHIGDSVKIIGNLIKDNWFDISSYGKEN